MWMARPSKTQWLISSYACYPRICTHFEAGPQATRHTQLACPSAVSCTCHLPFCGTSFSPRTNPRFLRKMKETILKQIHVGHFFIFLIQRTLLISGITRGFLRNLDDLASGFPYRWLSCSKEKYSFFSLCFSNCAQSHVCFQQKAGVA